MASLRYRLSFGNLPIAPRPYAKKRAPGGARLSLFPRLLRVVGGLTVAAHTQAFAFLFFGHPQTHDHVRDQVRDPGDDRRQDDRHADGFRLREDLACDRVVGRADDGAGDPVGYEPGTAELG